MSADAPVLSLAWPATLADGPVKLRPIRRSDQKRWLALREANQEWLAPWDATSPANGEQKPPSFGAYVRQSLHQAREGQSLPWMIEYDGELAGQLNVGGIARGAVQSGTIGYWVGRDFAGLGITPTAVALAFDHAVSAGGLHRLEVAIRPENSRSLRVVEKLGFREEGLRPRYLHVDGQWRDHRIFALTCEEVPEGLLRRWHDANGTNSD
ncbi:MAG: GNAT family N-acetyltransferase [Bifidobacteriaceae bacterium]|jgi:ribosomal-protein-alanine N-acetyltransferase|nr:GNAT family N-acetyltransferase [Bifidobacteriaceae bacterium]